MPKIDHLSRDEQIEYYLGKDKFRNLFFKPGIPEAWSIEFGHDEFKPGVKWKDLRNTCRVLDGIEFRFNNLGYRSNYDYHVDDLKIKKNILCLGDSDTFAPFLPYSQMWTTLLQEKLPDYNIVNLGMPGYASDTCARIGACVLQALDSSVTHVISIASAEGRREFVTKDIKKIISWPFVITNVPYETYWDFIDWQSNNYNNYKNELLLENMTRARGGTYLSLMINGTGKSAKLFDGEHGIFGICGPMTHQAIANYFYKKIMNLPSMFEQVS